MFCTIYYLLRTSYSRVILYHSYHKVNLDVFCLSSFEPLLDLVTGRVVNKVVHVAAHVDREAGKLGCVPAKMQRS